MKRIAFAVILAYFPGIGFGQSLKIEGDLKPAPYRLVELKCVGAVDGAAYIWDIFPEDKVDAREVGGKLLFVAPPGEYRVKCRAFTFSGGKLSADTARVTVVIGTPTPDPNPPKPPDPPTPTPIPPGEFRVLLLYESSANMTREQLNALNSTQITDYLNRKTAATDGGKGWRKWDKDVNTEKETATWKALWAATKSSITTLPAVCIVKGTKGELFPLPATEAETLAFLKRHGGE